MSLLQAYNAVHKYDIICLSETYLNCSIRYDDDNLEIPGYNLIRADHPSEDKRGGVCIYYKNKNYYSIGILCDFNAKPSTWGRSDKSTYEGSRIYGLVSNYGL